MKHLLISIAALVLVGCGESQQPTPVTEANPEPPTAKAPNISIVDAAMRGNIEAVKQHIAAGTDVNTKEVDGFTPLYFAAQNGQKEITELLIEKGADVNVKNYNKGGVTPLRGAVANSHMEIAELLIAKGANVNAKEDQGLTLLFFSGTKEIAELLIAKGLDVNAKADDGGTPLHDAAWSGYKAVAELFIAKAANVNSMDDRGETPLDWAIKEGQIGIGALLRKHGGKTGEELKAEGK